MNLNLKWGLLPQVVLAISAGILCGLFVPTWFVRVVLTFNGLFSNFLGFMIPLLVLGLVAPGIAELGRSAGKLLFLTVALAYGFTLTSGFFSYAISALTFPHLLDATSGITSFGQVAELTPYFTIEMPPLFNVITALVLAFVLGLGMAVIQGSRLKGIMLDFRDIIDKIIVKIIIPLLPVYIFGIFMNMTVNGQATSVLSVFAQIIVIIFAITAAMLLLQFIVAGIIGRKNPFTMLKHMLVAYATALGTQSSAATIPVTLRQTEKIGVREEVAGFVVPLCATIHMSGSTMKIVACALAVLIMNGQPFSLGQFAGFICMLGISIIAAPGVPGGAIMAALGVLENMLGFGQPELALMIALYIAMDSFGTACNVTGDGAIAVIVNKIYARKNPALLP